MLPAPSATPSSSPRVIAALRWVSHQGVPLLREDFTGLTEAEAAALVDHANAEILRTDGTTRELIIWSGTKISKQLLDFSTEASKQVAHKRPVSAIVGIIGVQKLILQMFNRFSSTPLVPFDTEAEARDWLISQRR